MSESASAPGEKMFPRSALHKPPVKGRALIAAVFSRGLSPRALSLTLTLGVALGVMPLPIGTTLLCVLLAARFRLNQAAMLAVNYLCYPLQLALFLPFSRLGEFLLPWGAAGGGAVITEALRGDVGGAFELAAWATARALGAWLLTALPLALLAYPILKVILCNKRERRSAVAVNAVGSN